MAPVSYEFLASGKTQENLTICDELSGKILDISLSIPKIIAKMFDI
jgi:hypothetical protein